MTHKPPSLTGRQVAGREVLGRHNADLEAKNKKDNSDRFGSFLQTFWALRSPSWDFVPLIALATSGKSKPRNGALLNTVLVAH